MNLALFVTQLNREDVSSFIEAATELQETTVNGAVVLIHDSSISVGEMNSLLLPLAAKFKVASLFPVQVNASLKQEAKLGSMFARFLLGCYTTHPGAWLIVDEFAVPVVKDFMQKAETQHNALGGRMTGRGVKGSGYILPVGPVTLALPVKEIKFLRFSTIESWRSRGRYHFGRCRFGMVENSEYLFSISDKTIDLSPPPAPVPPPKRTSSDIPKPFIDAGDTPAAERVVDIPAEPEVALTQEPSKYANFTREELLDEVLKRTFKKPHPSTGTAKLIAQLEELDQEAVSA